MTLHQIITSSKAELIDRWLNQIHGRVAARDLPSEAVIDSLPVFVEQLAAALAKGSSGAPAPNGVIDHPEVGTAASHGAQRLHFGFDVSQLVREYSTLLDCILQLAEERRSNPSPRELRELLSVLDAAKAAALTRYTNERDEEQRDQAGMHLAFLAHELRNPLGSARVALSMLRSRGQLPTNSRHVDVLDRSLLRLQELIDHSLLEVKLKATVTPVWSRIGVKELLEELVAESAADADEKGIRLQLDAAPELALNADTRMIRSAVGNLLRNAVKFTRTDGNLHVRAHDAGAGRIAIDIADECGGLPEGRVEQIFDPYVQISADRSGFGLGLAITRQAAEANGGSVRVHNRPGIGCVFTLELPSAGYGS